MESKSQQVRVVEGVVVVVGLAGFGSVGRTFLQVLMTKQSFLESIGVKVVVSFVADSSGALSLPPTSKHHFQGFDLKQLLELKRSGKRVLDLANLLLVDSLETALPNDQFDLLKQSGIQILFEATPVNSKSQFPFEPGLSFCETALRNGIDVVLANKGPLVANFEKLHQLAKENRRHLKYSATVCGGLPVINVIRRDLLGTKISSFRGIFNATTNFILKEMASGRNYHDALKEAQQRGIAETDPSLDVEGWDTAFKLLICCNSCLGQPCKLEDIRVEGITQITPQMIDEAKAKGLVYKLVASAQLNLSTNRYDLCVCPNLLPVDDFLARIIGWEMGVEIKSDLYETITLKLLEDEPISTSASMLRDSLHILKNTV